LREDRRSSSAEKGKGIQKKLAPENKERHKLGEPNGSLKRESVTGAFTTGHSSPD